MQSVSAIECKSAKAWFLITVFSAVFAAVYEMFSFGVLSLFMVSLPVIPFIFGLLPCMALKEDMGRTYNDGILMMMSGCALCGILEIYGTSSIWPFLMIVSGGLIILSALAVHCFRTEHSDS